MFAVVFEVQPKPDQWDAYLRIAGLLRPDLLAIEGFLDNTRYRSKRRDGLVLSLSTWEDEAALKRWRTQARHEDAQRQGREAVFQDYHLRVGEVVAEPSGQGAYLSLVQWTTPPDDAFSRLTASTAGIQDWDVFEAILTPGAMLLLISWRGAPAMDLSLPEAARHQVVRVVRDYGMFRRDEAPRFYPPVVRA